MGALGQESAVLNQLVSLLQRGVVSGGDAEEMMSLVRRCMRAVGVVVSNEFSYRGWAHLNGDLRDWPDRYHQVKHTDTTMDAIRASAPGSWFLIERSDDQHRRTAVYDAFVDERFGDSAICRLPSTRGDHITVGVYRERGAGAYDDDDKLVLDMLSPLLARALASRTALAALERDPREDRAAALAAVDGWATISYPRARVRWSRSARSLWQSELGAVGARGWTRIENALRFAAQNSAYTTCDAVRAARLLGNISVEFAYVPPEAGEARRVLALFFREPEPAACDLDPAARSAAEELLSPRQRLVARLASRGWAIPRIAATLDIGAETARDYLRAVYERLGVSTRTALARLLG